MYYYRTVCLKSEITQILSLSQVVYKYDKWAQEDFIVVCHRNLRKVLLFNIKIILNKIDDETLYGIVICLEEQEENGIEDIEQRYIQGGKKCQKLKLRMLWKKKNNIQMMICIILTHGEQIYHLEKLFLCMMKMNY